MNSLEQVLPWLQDKAVSMIRASLSPMRNGVSAFPPQVGSHYEAFWLRDFAYKLEGCVEAFSSRELTDARRVFVDAIGEDGAGVDCVKFDGTPICEPGYGSMEAIS